MRVALEHLLRISERVICLKSRNRTFSFFNVNFAIYSLIHSSILIKHLLMY